MKFLFILFITSLLVAPLSIAGEGGRGGNWTEGDLKHFLAKLVPYISSPEGQTLFPEVVAYDQSNPTDTFENILNGLNPSLVNHQVYDRDGNERDCVSGFDKGVRFFQCNVNSLPPKPDDKFSNAEKSEYYGSMYRLVLHEGFVQVGLERPLVKEVPSEYNLSSRLSVHLENFPEWVPGVTSSIVVPVPNGFGETGTLLVTGTPGAEQRTGLVFTRCDPSGQPVKYSCSEHLVGSSINYSITVAPGLYRLDYYGSWQFVQVKANQKTEVVLKKIQVGASSQENVHFRLFFDLTAPVMQELFLEDVFTSGWNQTTIESMCAHHSSKKDALACAAWKGNDFHALLNTNDVFNSDGSYSVWYFDTKNHNPKYHHFVNEGRRYMGDPVAGQFVSVFPGVYGIEFTDTNTGETLTQFGIVAK